MDVPLKQNEEFRDWLVDIMILFDLSPNGLARKCDLPLDTVSSLLVDSRTLPSLKTVRRIERAVDVPAPASVLDALQ